MDKITQLKTWLEDTIKHGGNNQHTLSGVLHKIDEIYEWDKCVLTKAREIEAEESILKVEDPLDKVRAGLKHRIKSYIEQKGIASNNSQIDFYDTVIQECQSVLDSELSQDTKKAREIQTEKPVWTPTKGEEIEVSDDGVKWINRCFKIMENKEFRCCFSLRSKSSFCWKYARPLTEGNCSEIPNS